MTEEEAMKHFENLVYFHAIRLSGVFEKEDLVSEGFIGVIHACRTYDPERSDNFSSHVGANIRNAMLKFMRHGRSGFYVPHNVEATRYKIYTSGLEQATPEKIAEELDISLSLAKRGLLTAKRGRVASLDVPLTEDEDNTLDGLTGICDDTSHVYVRDFVSRLSDRDRYILERRFNGDSQIDIAASLGVTQMSVSRYLRRIGERYKEEYA